MFPGAVGQTLFDIRKGKHVALNFPILNKRVN